MAIESGVADAWLVELLGGDKEFAGDVPGGIHDTVAPIGTTWPRCVFVVKEGVDTVGLQQRRLLVRLQYEVVIEAAFKAFSEIQEAADHMDGLLHGARDDETGMVCERLYPFKRVDVRNGVVFRVLGARYQITVRGEA